MARRTAALVAGAQRVAKTVAAIAPTALRDGAGLAGATAIAVGVGMIYLPAGVIVGGLELLAAALITARAS